MTKTLAVLSALTAFALAAQAVRDHAALIRTGYDISRLEKERERTVTSEAEARERVGRLRSPDVLAERASELGLATDYPEEFPVVHVFPGGRLTDTVLVQGRGR